MTDGATTHDPNLVGPPEKSSRAHVLGRLAVVEARVRAAVDRRRTAEPSAESLQSSLLSSHYVDRLLSVPPSLLNGADPGADTWVLVEERADESEHRGEHVRLRALERTFDLSTLDTELLVAAMAPEVDDRLEPLYGYLVDDSSVRHATIGLALGLAGAEVSDVDARARLRPGRPLVDGGLVEIDRRDRPFLSRTLRVADRVVMHLLGDDEPEPALADLLVRSPPSLAGDPDALASAVTRGARLSYLRESNGGSGRALAAAAMDSIGVPSLLVDLSLLPAEEDPARIAAIARREARLRGACLVAGPIDPLTASAPSALRSLADSSWPTILVGERSWDPAWCRSVPLVIDVEPMPAEERSWLWGAVLSAYDCEEGLDPGAETATFRLGAEQIDRAASAAWLEATYGNRPIAGEDLRRGAMAQNSAALEHLGRRIEPQATWDDLILPTAVKGRLREMLSQARSREVVLNDWGLGRTGQGGRGLVALFAGPSGTGKTLAAEVIAHELGFDLYTVDLSSLVDKYIGETEKNLDRVFHEAERVNGVLFFDEADALFGSRSEVRDSHDRYANLEVAYLLQRLELFDGVAMLATNMRTNIDEAFSRRMDAVMSFPLPDEGDRERLWQRFLSTGAPLADDLDLDFCAKQFALAGGSIRNICLAAAYYAADRDGAIEMADLIRGVRREYEKLGQLITRSEFGPYHELLS